MPGDFLDSNVLVYAFTDDPRTATARALLARGCTINVQGLNEFANVARRKLGHSWDEIGEALAVIRELSSTILPVSLDTHEAGSGWPSGTASRYSTR
jgi:predicted nucleic acid-binding protein